INDRLFRARCRSPLVVSTHSHAYQQWLAFSEAWRADGDDPSRAVLQLNFSWHPIPIALSIGPQQKRSLAALGMTTASDFDQQCLSSRAQQGIFATIGESLHCRRWIQMER